MSSRADRSILEMLNPLVYDDLKVWSFMGGRNLEKCQAILYSWDEWLQDHWKEDENTKTKYVGKYSAYHNRFSKDVILFYGLRGYRFFADSLKDEPELLVNMAIKAHAIELGPTFKKPRVIPVDPLRINIFNVPAFQRADDLFSHPEKYIKKDKEGNIIVEKSGWCPDEGEFSSPIFLWEVLTAYEANLFSHAYFIKAQKLAKGEYKDEGNDTPHPVDYSKGDLEKHH
ncbi:MAG: hypothetical protein KAU62_03425 [Candidatus Heimdallarchaeota archaeon]|nr:hypothetical protein [Candidatus Heimdallarchaeota archaeon]MCK4610189.1 hypothetical protein [Candidatus Heimdallarchaeota archaeon]